MIVFFLVVLCVLCDEGVLYEKYKSFSCKETKKFEIEWFGQNQCIFKNRPSLRQEPTNFIHVYNITSSGEIQDYDYSDDYTCSGKFKKSIIKEKCHLDGIDKSYKFSKLNESQIEDYIAPYVKDSSLTFFQWVNDDCTGPLKMIYFSEVGSCYPMNECNRGEKNFCGKWPNN